MSSSSWFSYRLILRLVLALAAMTPRSAFAAWTPNGVPVATNPTPEGAPVLVPDGAGGALIVWTAGPLIAKRLDANGEVASGWPAAGIVLRALGTSDYDPYAVPDGEGGGFIAFRASDGPGSIAALHLSPDGAILWNSIVGSPAAASILNTGYAPTSSMPNRTLHLGNILPFIAADGAGGAYVAYEDEARFTSCGYLRHYDPSGAYAEAPLSPTGCYVNIHYQRAPALCTAPDHGVFATWGGSEGISRFGADLGTQVGWPSEQAIPGFRTSAWYVGICEDGTGGAYVGWQPYYPSSNSIRLQRMNGDASVAAGWPADGIVLSPYVTAAGYARLYYTLLTSVVPDGLGGALIAWTDQRSDTGDVYVQRVLADGTIAPGWAPNGVAAGVAPDLQQYPVIVADGSGGALVAWQDHRDPSNYAIYAQRVLADGSLVGSSSGIPVSVAPSWRIAPRIAADGSGGAIIVWEDYRNGNADIYAAHVAASGAVAVGPRAVPGPLALAVTAVVPNPARGRFRVGVVLPDAEPARLDVLDVAGRIVWRRTLTIRNAGAQDVEFEGADRLAAGVYFLRLSQGPRFVKARFCVAP